MGCGSFGVVDPKEKAVAAFVPLLHQVGDAALATLARERSADAVVTLVDDAWIFAEKHTQHVLAQVDPAKLRLPVCAAGCDTCCHIHVVFASVPEVLRLARHLRETRTPEDLTRVVDAVTLRARSFAPMSIEQRARAKEPCALLQDGACSVHPARPLNCRGFNSCDVAKCKTAFERADPTLPLPVELTQFATCRNVWLGHMTGTYAAGLDPGPYELMNALAITLTVPDVEARWLRGERVFDAAETRVGRERRATFRGTFEAEKEELVGAARWGGEVTPTGAPRPSAEEAKKAANALRNRRKKAAKR